MLYFFWTLFNWFLVIYFFFICFKAWRLVKEHMSLPASIIFVVGLLSFSNNPYPVDSQLDKPESNIKMFEIPVEDSVIAHAGSSYLTLEKIGLTKINLSISYGTSKGLASKVPVEAYSAVSGLVGGHSWKPQSIIVNRKPNTSEFKYAVVGMLEWKLLGVNVYTQLKTFHGTVTL